MNPEGRAGEGFVKSPIATDYGPDEATKITQILQRDDGSEVRIVAEAFFGAGLRRSVGVYVHKRESPNHEWELCSDSPHPDWRSMSVDDYVKHGRSPMLQAVSSGELLRAISAIGMPMAQFDHVESARFNQVCGLTEAEVNGCELDSDLAPSVLRERGG